jgi:dTDP-glucose pyrophosphorylase
MTDWKSAVLHVDDTMEMAIRVLNSASLRIVMVADGNNRLLGTITDGDIRRALINKKTMDAAVSEIMFTNPTVGSVDDDRDSILTLMQSRDLLQIPVLDSDGKIVGLETLQQLLDTKKHDNAVFLMAGGFGKRLHPLTTDVPKPLLKVGNKPILETIINQFIDFGFHNFVISTHYKAEMIKDYFGEGSQWGVSINYVYENEPLGTAGALGLLPNDFTDLPMVVMNGDLLTKVNYDRLLAFHEEHGGIATMGVREYDFQVPYGIVRSAEHLVEGIEEKPVHRFFVNAGVYVLSPLLLREIESDKYLDMPHFLESQIRGNHQVNMFPIHEYWLDIGHREEFERAQNDMEDVFGD